MKSSLLAALVLASLPALAGGCSSSSTSDPGGGGNDQLDNAKQADDFCAVIPQGDAQSLLASNIISVDAKFVENVYDCNYVVNDSSGVDQDTDLSFYESDADDKHYDSVMNNFPALPPQDLGGAGDKGYWVQVGQDQGPPTVVTHKGDKTCIVQVTGNLDLTTLPHSNGVTVAASDAAAYAGKMAKLCADAYASGK